MLRCSLRNLMECSVININLQTVRWRRKPRWLPVAKSKVFRIPEKKHAPLEERQELLRLFNNYRTHMRSVRSYLHEEVKKKRETSTVDHLVVTPEEEQAEFKQCFEKNDTWNAIIAAERDQRLIIEASERKKLILGKLEKAKNREEMRQKEIEESIRREKEKAKTHINRDNLEKAIEFALANPVDHNFAIDLDGKTYNGREHLLAEKKEEKSITQL